MLEFVILDQTPPKYTQGNMKIIRDSSLWKKYLDELCILRGKVYIEEGLYSDDILTSDGKFEEKWDPISMHTIAVDNGKVIGGLRVTLLSENGLCYDGEIDYFLKKPNLEKHTRAFYAMLHNLSNSGKKIMEVSRLFVKEEYRRFRKPESNVGLGLIILTYSYFTDNKVDGVFIIQGNKYKTGRIYEKMGFVCLEDIDEKKPLEPFFEFDDICSLMYMDTSRISKLFLKFVDDMKREQLNITIICKKDSFRAIS